MPEHDSIIGSVGAIAAVDAELADLDTQRRQYVQSVREIGETERQALETWEQQRADAYARGEVPPPRPASSLPPAGDAATYFAARDNVLRSRRRAAIASNADTIRQTAREQLGKAPGKVAKLRDALDDLARDVTRIRVEVAEAVAAEDQQAGIQRDRPSPVVSAADLVNLGDGADLLADLGDTRQLGMTWENRESREAPEPSPEQLQLNRQHAERMRPGPVTARRGY